MKLQQLIDQARQKTREDHKSGEVLKKGNLRAGSTGILESDGSVAGACHRTSLIRSQGLELDPPTWDKFIMFELGYANEDVVKKQLVDILSEEHIVLAEEEIPIEWATTNGTKVTGRPDLVVCTGTDKKPVIGIELKSVHSMWVAREVLFNRHPKLNNLVQAAHYMWKLGDVPYKLFYKSYSQLGQGMAGNEWITKMFPKHGEPGSDFIEWTEVSEAQQAKGKGPTIKHLKQFEIIYDLRFDKHGRLQYKVESEVVWTNTIITRQGIQDYFEFVSQMEETKNLGPRPTSVDALGDKLSYSVCKYCALKSICDAYEKKGYDVWMAEVNKLAVK